MEEKLNQIQKDLLLRLYFIEVIVNKKMKIIDNKKIPEILIEDIKKDIEDIKTVLSIIKMVNTALRIHSERNEQIEKWLKEIKLNHAYFLGKISDFESSIVEEDFIEWKKNLQSIYI